MSARTDGSGDDSDPGPLRRFLDHPRVRRVETGLLIVLLAFAGWRLWPQVAAATGFDAGARGGAVGTAPAFAAVSLDGETVRSADLRGRVVVVNFWASWCVPCRLEMPALQDVHERWGPDRVAVVGIATDAREAPVRSFVAEHGITYPVVRVDADLRRSFGGIPGVPTTFLLDPEGVVRHRVYGLFAPPALREAVERLAGPAD